MTFSETIKLLETVDSFTLMLTVIFFFFRKGGVSAAREFLKIHSIGTGKPKVLDWFSSLYSVLILLLSIAVFLLNILVFAISLYSQNYGYIIIFGGVAAIIILLMLKFYYLPIMKYYRELAKQ